MTRLILASESPRRRDILRSAGWKFDCVISGIRETMCPGEFPRDMAERLSSLKAGIVSKREPDAVVVGADTVVDVDGVPLSKPLDRDDALRMLRMLNGRTHLVHTGISLASGGLVLSSEAETTEVTFGDMSDGELMEFVSSGVGDDKAGAYAIQGRGSLLVSGINGCYYNVVGLPVYRLKKMIEKFTPDLRLYC